jgi:hypothetical protein
MGSASTPKPKERKESANLFNNLQFISGMLSSVA